VRGDPPLNFLASGYSEECLGSSGLVEVDPQQGVEFGISVTLSGSPVGAGDGELAAQLAGYGYADFLPAVVAAGSGSLVAALLGGGLATAEGEVLATGSGSLVAALLGGGLATVGPPPAAAGTGSVRPALVGGGLATSSPSAIGAGLVSPALSGGGLATAEAAVTGTGAGHLVPGLAGGGSATGYSAVTAAGAAKVVPAIRGGGSASFSSPGLIVNGTIANGVQFFPTSGSTSGITVGMLMSDGGNVLSAGTHVTFVFATDLIFSPAASANVTEDVTFS
jgi:hypothetical protein